MNSIKILAGILLVGPDPPIPNKILVSSLLILYLDLEFLINCSFSVILGSLSISKFSSFFINSLAALIICWFFFLKQWVLMNNLDISNS